MRKGKKPHARVKMLSSGCEVVERYTLCDSGLVRARFAQKNICDRRSLRLDERAVRCVIVSY